MRPIVVPRRCNGPGVRARQEIDGTGKGRGTCRFPLPRRALDKFDAGIALPASERGRVERRIDAHARLGRVAATGLRECHDEFGRQDAARRRRVDRECTTIRPPHEARGLRIPRAPLPVGRRRGEIRLGDDTRDVRAMSSRCSRRATRDVMAMRTRPSGACAETATWWSTLGPASWSSSAKPAAPATRDAGIGGSAMTAMRACDAASTISRRSACGHAALRSWPFRTHVPAASKSAQVSARSAAGAAASRTRSTVMENGGEVPASR